MKLLWVSCSLLLVDFKCHGWKSHTKHIVQTSQSCLAATLCYPVTQTLITALLLPLILSQEADSFLSKMSLWRSHRRWGVTEKHVVKGAREREREKGGLRGIDGKETGKHRCIASILITAIKILVNLQNIVPSKSQHVSSVIMCMLACWHYSVQLHRATCLVKKH